MNSYELILPQLLKAKVFEHLETVYSSFMKYALSNHQNKLEHEQNSSGSTEFKSIYDGVENIAFPSIDLPRIFSNNITTHSDRLSTETFLEEEGVNSFNESKTIENSDQTLSKFNCFFTFSEINGTYLSEIRFLFNQALLP